ncbi:hypothetical protein LVD17_22705 [Fulvivirga ulvae]|uniref:hypothetical protein n=1 Tax=Fulvivirga ulvae TaxID=2904245 RepID=UPI001F1FBB5D|nr:hypothetical protein [Fulvivirga ulvae]UII31106.1 hypothetical protein LVD17_22705 [Fulvivirga ulvae]
MKSKAYLIIGVCLILARAVQAQTAFSPETIAGHRSFTYNHNLTLSLTEKIGLTNISWFDADYRNSANHIYFIRSGLSYRLEEAWRFDAGVGMKNPGSFATVSLGYQRFREVFSFSCTAGATYQAGWTMEPVLWAAWTPKLSSAQHLYLSLFVTGNIDKEAVQRGIQQVRLGLTQGQISYGLAANFDQFNDFTNTLYNLGFFLKGTF